ncbi:hypothetical protein LTR05_004145 [Lithohypha guttulata]|uniref:Uncharacterized protein n=1 Tax=Lithohypha guttulata TaxID=1690604 RepID=A0AAN7T3E3_9EURO|nr:hypothetical protein LTR05_004145 [Lithohypha guttulata]
MKNSKSQIHERQSAPLRQPKPITFPDMDRILQRHGIMRTSNAQFSIPHQSAQEKDMYHLRQATDSSSSRSKSRPQHGYLSFRPPPNHGDPDGPSNLQLLGYAGLEDAPFTGQLISTPKLHSVYKQYYEYDKTTCPAGILYFDPAGRQSREAWLYVRDEGMVEWKRDFLAERGGMRYFVYIKEEEDGWEWKQVLGDVIDGGAEVNLFVKMRAASPL